MHRPSRFLALLALAACVEAPAPPPPVVPCPDDQVEDGGLCLPASCGLAPFGALEPHPTEPTWYVLATADAPGDGSLSAPFPRLSTALEAASSVPGGRILVGAGRYAERLSFHRGHDGLEVIGRCPDVAIVDGGGLAAATLSIFASEVVVRGLTVTGGRPGIIAGEVPGAPGLVLRGNDLWVLDNGGHGVLATGAGVLVDLAASRVSGVVATNEVSPARGVGAEQGATVLLRDVEIEGIAGIALEVRGTASEAEVEDGRIVAQQAEAGAPAAVAVQGLAAARVVLRRTTVQGADGPALLLEGGAVAETEDAVLVGGSGRVVQLSTGASLRARRGSLQATGAAVVATGAGTFLDLADLAVIGESDVAGALLSLGDGSALLGQGLRVGPGGGAGILVGGLGSQASLIDVDVVGVGTGVVAVDGSEVEGDDLAVSATLGPGLLVARAGVLRCVACAIEDAGFAGALALNGGTLRLDGGRVSASRVDALAGGGFGVGAWGSAATLLRVDDTLISGHPFAGIVVRGLGSYRVASAIVETSGGGGQGPGLLAQAGTTPWEAESGLFVFGTLFRQLPNDAVLLDAASATLSGNAFDGVGQLELYRQSCAGVPAPVVAEALSSNDCGGPPRDLGAALDWPEPAAVE